MNKLFKIFIRKETYENEFRTPIVPSDINKLKLLGYEIFIESSVLRCFTDNEYNNCIIVNENWINYNDCLIIGIKELNDIEYLNNHTHIYFSHTYKNQLNSKYILQKFKDSNSILYDLEYFTNNNKRLITFGYYAGIMGCALAIIQYIYKKQNKVLKNLKYWNSINELIIYINSILININNICIIGLGNCGSGCIYLLDILNLNYIKLNRNSDKSNLIDYDIILNCINLTSDIGIWFDINTNFYKDIVICDISCDYNNIFNPIKIYNCKTLWSEPVYQYNNFVDIIAIDNLPSMLPLDSSTYFSNKLVELFNNNDNYWKNNYLVYQLKIYNI
jgi:saccharopine dehydrogenase (NAD+, L-lysine-forming)